jgi:hypothetical protein
MVIADAEKAEAGMFPAIILQLSYWYRPDEIAVRLVSICELTSTKVS